MVLEQETKHDETASDDAAGSTDAGWPPAVAALLGLVSLFGVGLVVTAYLEPYVWPSLLVGVPAGLVAGVLVTVVSYWLLTRWQRRAAAQHED
jgi:membrane protein implicated in regulation of membrane protease activity